MREPQDDGFPRRVHLERLAERGHAGAIAALAGSPPMPEALRYLHEWALELDAGRRWDMAGGRPMAVPLSYGEMEAWSRLTDRRLEPREVKALLTLDAVLRYPDGD